MNIYSYCNEKPMFTQGGPSRRPIQEISMGLSKGRTEFLSPGRLGTELRSGKHITNIFFLYSLPRWYYQVSGFKHHLCADDCQIYISTQDKTLGLWIAYTIFLLTYLYVDIDRNLKCTKLSFWSSSVPPSNFPLNSLCSYDCFYALFCKF